MNIYNIYCDESCHLEHDNAKVMAIGGVWCPEDRKDAIFNDIRDIKRKHGLSPSLEIKWHKVSKGKIDFYLDIVNYFFHNDNLHFRVLVANKEEHNHEKYDITHDELYYKLYFDMLKTIFEPESAYNIYIDIKDTRSQEKVEGLHEALCNNHYDFDRKLIRKVQQVRSHEVELVALADLLIGAITYVNRGLNGNSAKERIVELIKEKTGYSLTSSTLYRETKFNVYIWKGLNGK